MSKWEDFATASPSVAFGGRTEDLPVLTSVEEYALFQELTFLKVADAFLRPPSNLNPDKLHFVIHRMRSTKNHKLRTKKLTFDYHGFSDVLWGEVIVTETIYPRGYRVTKLLRGKRGDSYYGEKPNKWISWFDAVANRFDDDLLWH